MRRRTRRRRCVLLALLFVLSGAAGAEEPAADDPAVQAIHRLDDVLLEIMRRAEELGYWGRYERVAPIVRETFDVLFMARKTVGRHWKSFSQSERDRWVEAFTAFTISNFADRFDGYSGESFEILGQKPASHETLVVRTKLIRPDEEDVSLDYRMRAAERGWKIVDVYSGGNVSEVALRRSEYAAVLRQGGVEQLIDSVAAKAERRSRK